MTFSARRMPKPVFWLLAFLLAAHSLLWACRPAGVGEQIEICTGLGTQWVSVDAAGVPIEGTPHAGEHCQLCLSGAQSGLPGSLGGPVEAISLRKTRVSPPVAANPGWTDPFQLYLSRAPPRA